MAELKPELLNHPAIKWVLNMEPSYNDPENTLGTVVEESWNTPRRLSYRALEAQMHKLARTAWEERNDLTKTDPVIAIVNRSTGVMSGPISLHPSKGGVLPEKFITQLRKARRYVDSGSRFEGSKVYDWAFVIVEEVSA
jgi:hypothetical protein